MSNGTLEITTLLGCPVGCRCCPQPLLLEACPGLPRRMTLDTFRACLEKVPAEVRIDFSGMAEPWLNPDCRAMLGIAAGGGHPLAVFTTLLGMGPADLEALAELELERLVFHLPDAQGNSPIPVNGKYLARVGRALDLLARRPAWKTVRISCHGTLHPRLAAAFGQRLAELGVAVVSSLNDRAGALDGPGLAHTRAEGRIACSTAGRSLNHNVLLPDGRVLLCCMDYGCRHVLGNLLTQSYAALFSGAGMAAVRAGLDDPALALICRRCGRAVPAEFERRKNGD